MAVYGSAIEEGASEAEALEAVKTVLEKTTAQPGSGRDAFSAFSQGEGNVLLTYENEAIKAEKEGEEVEYVIPPYTIQIETPIAVTKEAPEPAAEDFLKFLWSNEGQELWAENGYRPVNPKLVDPKQFPTPKKACSRSANSAAGARSRTNSSTKKPARSPRSRKNSASRHLRLIDGGPRRNRHVAFRHPGGEVNLRLPGVGARPRPRHGRALPEPDRAAAAGGARSRSLQPAGSSTFWDSGQLAAGEVHRWS